MTPSSGRLRDAARRRGFVVPPAIVKQSPDERGPQRPTEIREGSSGGRQGAPVVQESKLRGM